MRLSRYGICSRIPKSPRSPLFPYTTLFRSMCDADIKLNIGHDSTKGLGAGADPDVGLAAASESRDRKSTRLNSSHPSISYAVFRWKKKKTGLKARASARTDAASRSTWKAGS